jgi:hypothetical protein
MTHTVVFTGPTILVSHASAILDADYREPAKAGDVLFAAQSHPTAIVLIDGLFETVPSVWHKEILFALSEGIYVYGSSSMGALRAAELHTFGMIGVGKVFEAYRSGVLEDDDEVAVTHASGASGWTVQSEAMVNVREGLRLAVSHSVISAMTHDCLLAIGKAMHYSERSWPVILRLGAAEGLPLDQLGGLKQFLEATDTNVKRQDAVQLLHRVAKDIAGDLPPFKPTFNFERTSFFEALRNTIGRNGGNR